MSMLAGVLFGAIISEASYYFLRSGETRAPRLVELDIPAGTAERVAQGEADPALPSTMSFVVGDTLLVKNYDSVVHQLGPLLIPSGAAASMKLDSEKDYVATCSFQPSRYLGLNIQSPLTLGTRLVGVLEVGIPLGFLIALYGLFAVPVRKEAVA